MEHIWRTGQELGPVSGDSTNKETLVFPGASLRGCPWKGPCPSRCPFVPVDPPDLATLHPQPSALVMPPVSSSSQGPEAGAR